MNTKITYLYRDNSNYKQGNEAVLAGEITQEQLQVIHDHLFTGDQFVPRQFGLPEYRITDYRTDDDTAFFELEIMADPEGNVLPIFGQPNFTFTDDPPTVNKTVAELAAEFEAIKSATDWDTWSWEEDYEYKSYEELEAEYNEQYEADNPPEEPPFDPLGHLMDVTGRLIVALKGYAVENGVSEADFESVIQSQLGMTEQELQAFAAVIHDQTPNATKNLAFSAYEHKPTTLEAFLQEEVDFRFSEILDVNEKLDRLKIGDERRKELVEAGVDALMEDDTALDYDAMDETLTLVVNEFILSSLPEYFVKLPSAQLNRLHEFLLSDWQEELPVLLRKQAPFTPFAVHVVCSEGTAPHNRGPFQDGKIAFSFVCDDVDTYAMNDAADEGKTYWIDPAEVETAFGMSYDQVEQYGNGEQIHGWHAFDGTVMHNRSGVVPPEDASYIE